MQARPQDSVPRSAYGGIVYFARMLDKIRLHGAGALRADFHANLGSGFDGRCCPERRGMHICRPLAVGGVALLLVMRVVAQTGSVGLTVERLGDGPIITPQLDPSIGSNIQGPSLIRVPDWIRAPQGNYYLYFAAHKGDSIRLAYADNLLGPWHIYKPGTVQLVESHFAKRPPAGTKKEIDRFRAQWNPAGWSHDMMTEATTPHIASPDVHIDSSRRLIIMYFHGLESLGHQITRVATSSDGLHFTTRRKILIDSTYLRTFDYDGCIYGMAMPGQFYRAHDPLGSFEEGPRLFEAKMRHAALLQRGDVLYVFWTRVGDAREGILMSTINLAGDWKRWSATPAVQILRPERPWEGADAPIQPSVRSTAYGHVNQLRDPALYEENGHIFLLYAVAGESGIAIAELRFRPLAGTK